MEIMWILFAAWYFTEHGLSDLAFHFRGQPSPRDQRRQSRQRAVTDWAKQRKTGGTAKRPEGPWRGYFRDLNADCAAGATERRRAMRDNRKARRDRRKTRKTEAKRQREEAARTPVSLAKSTPGPGERGCRRHIGTGFCNRPTDGGRYCADCEADLVPGDDPEPDPPVDHEPPTEQEPAQPEDDRPQPVADQPAQPEQPQTSAAEPKGTTMAVINPAEGGLESVDVFANTYAQIVNDLWSATETTAANFPPELAPGTNAALNTLLRDLDAMGTAGLEALRAAVAADKAVRDAYAATGNTASNKSVLVS